MGIEEIAKIKDKEKFLDWFVYNLISVSKSELRPEFEKQRKKEKGYKSSLPGGPSLPVPEAIAPRPIPQGLPQGPLAMQHLIRKIGAKEISKPELIKPALQVPRLKAIPLAPMPIAVIKPLQLIASLDNLLQDKTIKTIEGVAGENVTILRNGVKEKISLPLSEEDIKNKIQEFSEKTKIPVTEGIFDASFENLHINAILSDMMPSRFLIEKKD